MDEDGGEIIACDFAFSCLAFLKSCLPFIMDTRELFLLIIDMVGGLKPSHKDLKQWLCFYPFVRLNS